MIIVELTTAEGNVTREVPADTYRIVDGHLIVEPSYDPDSCTVFNSKFWLDVRKEDALERDQDQPD